MKTYFRLLSFAKPIEKFAIPYIIVTLLAIFFNTLNLALLAPLMETLFSDTKTGIAHAAVAIKPTSWLDPMASFKNFVQYLITQYDGKFALKVVCSMIVASVILSNIFRYASQRIMENLKLHTLLNLRKAVFNNVMDLHLGFFNNERKGDII